MVNSYLNIGWVTNSDFEPKYWIEDSPKPGSQSENDLVRVNAELIAQHTAIIAQSGSGKSFLLGRFIEEIVLNTKANLIIFDPNSDFAKLKEVESKTLWENAKYKNNLGKLPHEENKDIFAEIWKNIEINIHSNSKKKINSGAIKLQFSWFDLKVNTLSFGLTNEHISEIKQCHYCVKLLMRFQETKQNGSKMEIRKTMDIIQDLLKRRQNKVDFRNMIKQLYPYSIFSNSTANNLKLPTYNYYLNNLVRFSNYISDEMLKYYFSQAFIYIRQKYVLDTIQNPNIKGNINVIDLASLTDPGIKMLFAENIVNSIKRVNFLNWETALEQNENEDNRVPTFIVIDEAHNLIPSNPQNVEEKSIVELFRNIIAEGRKYGTFLILVSQRPDKLDPMVLSECENKIIMKLSSNSVINTLKDTLNTEDLPDKLLNKTLEFKSGRGILFGAWSKGIPTPFYTAARRTKGGGRNLRPDYWAVK